MPTTTVPLLPCLDVSRTVEFYSALGFTATHEQTRPYLYLAFTHADFEIHFKEPAPHLDPDDELSGGALVLVDDVADFHKGFVAGLRSYYGRVPTTGLPRITRLRPGQTRFRLYDPSGNCVVFILHDEPEIEYGGARTLSGLVKALDKARIFRDFKDDDALAARALDAALNRYRHNASRIDIARALADRAELAIALGDGEVADRMRAELAALALMDDERAQLAAELTALRDIELWMG